MNKRAAGLGWVLAAVGFAIALVYVTFIGSVLNSCGAGNYGPNPGAEEDFCGYSSGEPSDYSALFVFVQLIPAIPVLVGGLLPGLGRSRLFFFGGLGVGVLCTGLIWALEPLFRQSFRQALSHRPERTLKNGQTAAGRWPFFFLHADSCDARPPQRGACQGAGSSARGLSALYSPHNGLSALALLLPVAAGS
jgi:hypothetical protein